VTILIPNARLELLRSLASAEELYEQSAAEDMAAHGDVYSPTHYPLFCGEWANTREDIEIAAREASRLGDIELIESGLLRLMDNGPMVRITPQGRAWIAAELLLGEAAQEGT